MDYETLGPVPYDEDCFPAGHHLCRKETAIFKRQLLRIFNPQYCDLAVRSFPHDFGTYHEVVVNYNENEKESVDEMLEIEANIPSHWDIFAKAELSRIMEPVEFNKRFSRYPLL